MFRHRLFDRVLSGARMSSKKRRTLPARRREPRFECLEQRRLLSVSPIGYDGAAISGGSATSGVNDYLLCDNWGGAFADAEKTSGSNEDDYLSWGAAAANVLEWTGWGIVDGMDDTDDMLDHFEDSWTDDLGNAYCAWEWWFDGTNNMQGQGGWAQEDVAGGEFYPSETFLDYYTSNWDDQTSTWDVDDSMSYVDSFLRDGYGIVLTLAGGGDHQVTCWGYSYDTTTDDYEGIWISDSDNDKTSGAPDDELNYFPVAYDSQNGRWHVQGYGGTNDWYITEVQGLAPNRTDLGVVVYADRLDHEVIGSDQWYELETAHDGYLTVATWPEGEDDGVAITLYDSTFTLLATSTAYGEDHRLDYVADEGETYWFRLEATGDPTVVDLRVANYLHFDDATDEVTTYDTDGYDKLDFDLDESGNYVIEMHYVRYKFDPADVTRITLTSDDDEDRVELTDSTGNDYLIISPNYATFDLNYDTDDVVEVEVIGFTEIAAYAITDQGTDVVELHGSENDDTASPSHMTDSTGGWYPVWTYWNNASNFEVSHVYGEGGFDDINLSGTDYSDEITVNPATGVVTLNTEYLNQGDLGVDVTATGFEDVDYNARQMGPDDIAYIYDATSSDKAELTWNAVYNEWNAKLNLDYAQGGDAEFYLQSLAMVEFVSQNGGDDLIEISDSEFDDDLAVDPDTGTVTLDSDGTARFDLTATGFDLINAASSNGGSDTATISDLDGSNDELIVNPATGTTTMDLGSDEDVEITVNDYAIITASAGTGTDTAVLYDSVGSDSFKGYPTYATMDYGGDSSVEVTVNAFEAVESHSTNGGSDVAFLWDSAGNDAFAGNAADAYAQLSGAGYLRRASSFATVHAYSTTGADTATFSDSPDNDSFWANAANDYARLFGTGYSYQASSFPTVTATSSTGVDGAVFWDTSGSDSFWANGASDYAKLFGAGYTYRANAFPTVNAYSSTGSDTAVFWDTSGNDSFWGHGANDYARLFGTGYSYQANSFPTVNAYSSTGADGAILWDTSGNDSFWGHGANDYAKLFGTGYSFQANSFPTVNAYSSTGTDAAVFWDTSGSDAFWGNGAGDYAKLFGTGYSFQADSFPTVNAYSSTGSDTAAFWDTSGNDSFWGHGASDYARLFGTGYSYQANSFPTVDAYSTTGTDAAVFWDTSGNDQYWGHGGNDYAKLFGTGYSFQANSFSTVNAYSSTGADAAVFWDTSGNDSLWAHAVNDYARLFGAGYSFQANSFPSVSTYASTGSDSAILWDSSGNDTFTAYETYSEMSDTAQSQYYFKASGFDSVIGDFARGGADTVNLYDSPGVDELTADAAWARIELAAGRTTKAQALDAYDTVYAYSADAEDDDEDIDATLDFTLDLTNWDG